MSFRQPHILSHLASGLAALWLLLSGGMAQASPDVVVDGTPWQTSLDGRTADIARDSIFVSLKPPSETKFSDTNQLVPALMGVCREIVQQPEAFADDQVDLADLTFVMVVVDLDGERLYPYPFSHRIVDGACSGTISFQMPTLEAPFSNHNPNDEFFSILNSWGLAGPELAFETGIEGKVIKAEIEVLPNFGRDITTLNAGALCIHAIANLETSFRAYGIPINPGNYPKIEIEVVARSTGLLLNRTQVLGRTEFQLKDGLCTG